MNKHLQAVYELTEASFWSFACALYGKPGVKDICLNLQDSQNINVNLVLLLCWCEQHQRPLDKAQIDQLIAGVAPWHRDYTQPLRTLRRRLSQDKAATTETKSQMLAAELALEKVEQALLLEIFNGFEVGLKVEVSRCLEIYLGEHEAVAKLRLSL